MRSLTAPILAVLMLATAACNERDADPKPPLPFSSPLPEAADMPLPGGWIVRTAADDDVRAAAAEAVAATGRAGVSLMTIESAQSQVVAGVNYRLDIWLSDKSRWRAVVWKKLDRTMEVTELMPLTGKP